MMNNHSLLLEAVRDDDVWEIERLISITDSDAHKYAVIEAARMGHTWVVEFLINNSDPSINHSEALEAAVENIYIDCVKLLIPVSNVKDNHSSALQYAAHCENEEMFDLLSPLSDIADALAHIPPYQENAKAFMQEKIARKELKEIYDHISVTKNERGAKKM